MSLKLVNNLVFKTIFKNPSYFLQQSRLNYFNSISLLNANSKLLNKPKINFFILNSIRNESVTAKKSITVYFIDRDGDKVQAKAKIGTNLLDVAIDNQIDLEGFGACEGTLSCSTCHLILEKENYDKLKAPSDEENDMLDLAFALTETSRLGCQIVVNEKMEGWTFVVPKEVADARN